jgi:hypothetical protein
MDAIFIVLVVVIVLDLIAWKWGTDSRERLDSPEWERRSRWTAFH